MRNSVCCPPKPQVRTNYRSNFLNRFLWISRVSWKLKPWIPYGKGSKNHTFARIQFFIVSAPIRERFCSPENTKDPVPVHFGGPWWQSWDPCGEYFLTVFFEVLSGTSISRESVSKGEGGIALTSFHLPPLTLSPPAPQ